MNSRTIIVFVIALLLAAAAGFGLGLWRDAQPAAPASQGVDPAAAAPETAAGSLTATPESTPPRKPTVTSATPSPGATAAPAPTAPVPVVLPPRDLPIAALYDELAARARAGDARASCRLAVDLQRCSRLPSLRQQTSWSESLATRDEADRPSWGGTEEQRIDQAARMAETLEKVEALCEGLPAGRSDEAFDWLLRAADLGHVPSMVRFASMPAVPFDQFLQELDRLAVYRDRAPAFAEAALRAGSMNALQILSEAYRPGPSRAGFLGQVLKDDPVRAQAYATLAVELRGPVPETARGGRGFGRRRGFELPLQLTAEQQEAAEEMTRQLRDTTFAGTREELARRASDSSFDPYDPNDSGLCEADR